jgi:hypothetical protein
LNKEEHEDILKEIKDVKESIKNIEEALYQTKNRSGQDPLNFPIKLGNKLAAINGVAGSGEWKPTKQAYEVRDMLVGKIDIQIARFQVVNENRIPALNAKLKAADIAYIK